MSDEPIQPALSPEEWEARYHWIQCFDSWEGEEVQRITGVGEIRADDAHLSVTSHQHHLHAVFDAPSDRHALAALCLYGQPFGFTWQDVARVLAEADSHQYEALKRERNGFEAKQDRDHEAYWRSLATRIAALLPPEPAGGEVSDGKTAEVHRVTELRFGGMRVEVDATMPPDVLEFRDAQGRVLGRITSLDVVPHARESERGDSPRVPPPFPCPWCSSLNSNTDEELLIRHLETDHPDDSTR